MIFCGKSVFVLKDAAFYYENEYIEFDWKNNKDLCEGFIKNALIKPFV